MARKVQRVAVTGATGFLGGALARKLANDGFSVVGLGRNEAKGRALRESGIEFKTCDLSEANQLQSSFLGVDTVIHSGALSSPWGRRRDFVAANVDGTRNVLDACARNSVGRLVHISSPSVLFDYNEQRDLNESEPWTSRPANDYIATKREAETIAREANAIILRPKALFGPGDTTLLPRIIRVAESGSFPLPGHHDPLMDLTWIGDAVEAVCLAIGAPDTFRGNVYHITSGSPQVRSEVMRTLFDACELDVRFRRISLGKALAIAGGLEAVSRIFTRGRWEPPVTRYSIGALGFGQTLDISAAREDLNYTPKTDVLAALAECGRRWRAEQEAASR